MKSILIFIGIFAISNLCMSQKGNGKITVDIEKLKTHITFNKVGDSARYQSLCLDDTCFSKISVYLLDKYGSLKMLGYDSLGLFIQYNYIGRKRNFFYLDVDEYDAYGKVVRVKRQKYFSPRLHSVLKLR